MWVANLQQIHPKDAQDRDYDFWVLFLRLDAGTRHEKIISDRHQKIDAIFAEQNVLYAEVTTHQGKTEIYNKFSFKQGKHPLFFVFHKYPLHYKPKESYLVVEWGKWSDMDSFRNDLMAFVTFFSDSELRKKIAAAKDKKIWSVFMEFLKENGLELFITGIRIATSS